MATKLPSNFAYVENVCVSYKVDPAAVAPNELEGFRAVVLTGPAVGTNKPCVNYPSAATDCPIGILVDGCPPTSGDHPSPAVNHVTAVHSDTFIIEVEPLANITVGAPISLTADGKATEIGGPNELVVGATTFKWVAKDESLGTSTVASPDYIRVILSAG